MIIYPAIDIRGGRCVRLTEGRFAAETVFADDPAKIALKWAGMGAEFLHLVDLDGALAGEGKNVPVIERILQSVSIPVQLGGGIRNLETIEKLLSLGVTRLILGSAAVKNPQLVEEACKKYPGHIAVGIDAKNGEVAIEGWRKGSGVAATEQAKQMAAYGVETIIYTDISRDGMLTGPNFEMLSQLQQLPFIRLIASGGMSSIDDLKKLQAMGVYGAITGKALYEGKITMAEIRALGGM